MNRYFILTLFIHLFLGVSCAFEGRLVPVDPLELRSPKYEIRGFGSASSSGHVTLKSKIESGKKVKKGEVIAEFKVSAHWMVSRAKRELNLVKSKARVSSQKYVESISDKKTGIQRANIDLEKLMIQLGASSVMAQQDLSRLKIDIKIQKIEIRDLEADLSYLEDLVQIEKKHHETKLEMVLSETTHINVQLDRFVSKAPVDGYVFFPHHNEYKRPLKVNDGISCGSVCIYVSTTKSAALEFFVPERFFRQLKVGKKALLTIVKTGKTHQAQIVSWNPFLQILAVIKNDSSILNNYDKFILVRAKLIDQISSFSEGTEVDVRLEWIQEL
ncbi:hypothetical protein MJH12_11050 [bacterium]|nr:hypothetical protein [bacterium]